MCGKTNTNSLNEVHLCVFANLYLSMLFFQPDISKYSADILPLLFERLVNSSESGKSSASITRTYYALETFCENLGNVDVYNEQNKRLILSVQPVLFTTSWFMVWSQCQLVNIIVSFTADY